MSMHCTDSSIEYLTPKLKQYIADRVVQRFREHRKARQGIVLLDAQLFQELIIAALNDAEHEGLVEDSLKLPAASTLIEDQDFFAEIRWHLPLPDQPEDLA